MYVHIIFDDHIVNKLVMC